VETHIPEKIADFVDDGEFDCEMIYVESEHSALSAAVGASATGVRTYTATASQGLALMFEILHVASGMRVPIVMSVANRALSAPINIWNDHQDSMSSRDTGWIQLYVESSQEALDTTIQAFKIAENKDIMTPIMVCLDGFTLSHVYEPVDIPEQKKVDSFLPKFTPEFRLDPRKPVSFGPVAFPNSFMTFKRQQQDALARSLDTIKKANFEFKKEFGRAYGDGLLETYKMEDADFAFMGLGTICGTARVVIDKMRNEGVKVGMIKMRCFRPFPEDALRAACKNLRGLAVFDRAVSFGQKGPVFSEVQSALLTADSRPVIHSFIAGLGGADVTLNHIEKALRKTVKEKVPTTEWLMEQ
jgi:pyruvate ferredoxin oxidoreductase alpha subunit